MNYSAEPQAGAGSRLAPAVLRNSRMLELIAGGEHIDCLTVPGGRPPKCVDSANGYGVEGPVALEEKIMPVVDYYSQREPAADAVIWRFMDLRKFHVKSRVCIRALTGQPPLAPVSHSNSRLTTHSGPRPL